MNSELRLATLSPDLTGNVSSIHDAQLQESGEEQQKYALEILNQYLSPLVNYLADTEINEIMINSPSDIWIEKHGNLQRVDVQLNPYTVDSVITMIASRNCKKALQTLDARLPHLRIAAAREPTALRGPMLCIRRHAAKEIPLQAYVVNRAFDVLPLDPIKQATQGSTLESMRLGLRHGGSAVAEFFQWAIDNHFNILLSGGTSSGKTTLLNALLDLIPRHERVITIEDTAELQVRVPNYVSLEANANLNITVRDLVRLSLRARPDRIIVGEVRGAEAFDLLDALNTGHSGSIATLHSDSSGLTLPRLENMLRMATETQNWPLLDMRRQIASTFRFVVYAQRVGATRGPSEIREILGVDPVTGHYQTRLLFSKIQLEDAAYEL